MAVPPVVDGKGAVSGLFRSSGKAYCTAIYTGTGDMSRAEWSSSFRSWRHYIHGNDALDFMLLGARNIQVTTSVMEYGYRIVEDIISGIMHFMDERGFYDLNDIVGLALPNIVPPSEFTREYVEFRPEFCDEKCCRMWKVLYILL